MVLNVKELYLYVKRGDFMIGIIGAMEEEVKALLDKTEAIHEKQIMTLNMLLILVLLVV